ncbi:L-serine dehydratase [Lacrimispora xylanisolvens]|uniref:L-serine deaminase n=1 Tax=Lacrimispora xylanisolvens TaxID=384636 RepID=A0A2S6HV73_9FIRM|nr:L-serine ammonia-lyase, iron-sulfur-dependent subunit beta [Hungatella xylanolytica]MBE5990447.1 L-serine ammonia-lyase, iron-sulfur-dependent, subunit beta [Paenibacillaceae bacterium]PPK81664.1 L-serine dehydratase [Hungatella xylanolytica]
MNVFDIVGPVMIGPSSSHTAGAARIGKTAALLLGEPVAKADILFHGSFAKTYKGHGTDKAIVGGILKYDPWDPGIRTSLETAQLQGICVDIHTGTIENAHPNTALVTLTGSGGTTISVQGASIGGGNIIITKINDMEVYFTGQNTTLIVMHQDVPGIIAQVTNLVAAGNANICNFRLNRQEKGGIAIMTIEMDSDVDPSLVSEIRLLPHVYNTILLKLG